MIKRFGSELLLLLTAAIWGFAFVAQKKGMDNLDPFIYNGIRFALGALFVGLISLKTNKTRIAQPQPFPWLLGLVLFIAASLQQLGMVWTTAGNAGFITGLYIIFVPLLGIYRHQKISLELKISIGLALGGLYLINSHQGISITMGNAIVLVGAVFWGLHVQLIDKLTSRYDTFYLAFAQCSICAILSLITGLVYHLVPQPDFLRHREFWNSIYLAAVPILYGGLMSVGIAYTLQVYAQKQTKPANAAVILCLEAVFALLGGWWLLSETVNPARITGAALLLGAMFLSLLRRTNLFFGRKSQ